MELNGSLTCFLSGDAESKQFKETQFKLCINVIKNFSWQWRFSSKPPT